MSGLNLNRRSFFLFVLFLALIHGGYGHCEPHKKRSLKDSLKGSKQQPLVITSKKLITDNFKNNATFSGGVKATRGDIVFTANTMIVSYDDKGNIVKIDAHGNVKLTRQTKVLTAGRAVYYTKKEQVVFTGSPQAKDGRNLIKGSKMTYYIKEDRSVVENSKVFLVNE